jgi:hypothetical protein
LTSYSLRFLAGFVSHRQRSWDLPFGAFPSRKVPERFRSREPTYRFSRECARRRSDVPASRAAVPGLSPSRECLTAGTGLMCRTAGGSHGLLPFRVLRRAPWPRFRPTSSHALPTTDPRTCSPAPQSIDQHSPRLVRFRRQAAKNVQDNPLRVFAPAESKTFERNTTRAYEFASRRAVHCCRHPTFFEWSLSLYLSCPDQTEVPSILRLRSAIKTIYQQQDAVKLHGVFAPH